MSKIAVTVFAVGFAAALYAVPLPVLAAEATSAGYVVSPMPPSDARVNFLPPQGAVYVLNQATGKIAFCFPDADKDKQWVVICTPATKLAQ